jgi:hypothetical protein
MRVTASPSAGDVQTCRIPDCSASVQRDRGVSEILLSELGQRKAQRKRGHPQQRLPHALADECGMFRR